MRRTAKTILTILSVTCMLTLFAIAGGSDAGTVSAGQALVYGALALAGCIGCAIGAEAIHE